MYSQNLSNRWSFMSVFGITVFLLSPDIGGQSFKKANNSVPVSDKTSSIGCSWADIDANGFLDLFVTNGLEGGKQNNSFFYSDNNLTFVNKRDDIIAKHSSYSESSSWGDFDNDGHIDLFVTNSGWGSGSSKNCLYHNEGDGSFIQVTGADIVNGTGNSRGCSWGDYDNDGLLDLFVASESGKNSLFNNLGDGCFSKITTGEIVTDRAKSIGCSWVDYDNDRDLDLYVVNLGKNDLYQNTGNGSFEKVLDSEIVSENSSSAGCSWGDYDNDGFLDVFVANVNNQVNHLFKNNGDGSFTRITDGAIVTDKSVSFGSCWADFNNDGYLDLFVTNWQNQLNGLYINQADGSFFKLSTGIIATDRGNSEGCAAADYDNDGDLDIYVANYSGQQNFLYINQSTGNNWIQIKCVGSVSNKSAIGARVHVRSRIAGKVVWQTREIQGQTGYQSQNSLNVEFGLGDADLVDSLVVQWPANGRKTLTRLGPNQMITVIESNNSSNTKRAINHSPRAFYLDQNFPNPFNPASRITYTLRIPAHTILRVFNMRGQLVRTLVDGMKEAGKHQVEWRGKNSRGESVSSGAYLYQIDVTADNGYRFQEVKKMLKLD